MNRSLKLIVPALLLAIVLFGTACDRLGMPEKPAPVTSGSVCGLPTQVILYAGQTINAGNVTVWNDQTDLYVQFNTSGGWLMTESHVAVATSLAGIPQKNGNPIPGQFPYSMVHNPPVTTYTYAIPLGSWQPGQQLYIAAHAVVVMLDQYGNVIRRETGWGNGPNFPGKNWATYLMYTVQSCNQPLPGPLLGQFNTYTQGGWGAVPKGNNPGSYLHNNFAGAFPSGVVVGGGYTLSLTSAQAVTDYLPDGGTPMALAQNWVNPVLSITVLAGQTVALTLNVGFDLYDPNFSVSAVNLGDLKVADISSPYYGWTVQQVLAEANSILGGGAGSPLQINDAVSAINENFDNGNTDNGFLELP
jgi:hypothetical protein